VSDWRLIRSGPAGAFENMAVDEALALGAERPVFRLYRWAIPSVSIGCFQRAGDVSPEYLARRGIPLVRRVTGGRGILHGLDLTYSLSAPSAGVFAGGLRDCYALVGGALARALRSLGLEPETARSPKPRGRARSPLCFESVSFGEIKVGGRKVVGSAQKRWPGRFMQQGSLPLSIDYEELARVFGDGASEARASMAGLGEIEPSLDIEDLELALVDAFEETFGIRFDASYLTPGEEAIAEELMTRYCYPDWNLRRQTPSRAQAQDSAASRP
jgi:lipoate-protein ligase A